MNQCQHALDGSRAAITSQNFKMVPGIVSILLLSLQFSRFVHPSQICEIERIVSNQRSSLQSVNFEGDTKLIQVIRHDGSYFYPIDDINLDQVTYFAEGQTCLEKKVYVLESTDAGYEREEFENREFGYRKPFKILVKANWMEETHRIFHLTLVYYNTIEHKVEWTRAPSSSRDITTVNPITDDTGEIIGQLICSSINCTQHFLELERPIVIPPILLELYRVRIFAQKSQGMKRDEEYWHKYPKMYEDACGGKRRLEKSLAANKKSHHHNQEVKDFKHFLKLECAGDEVSEIFSTYLNQLNGQRSKFSDIEYFLRYNCKLTARDEGVFFTRFFMEIFNQIQAETPEEAAPAPISTICSPSNATLVLTRIVFHTIRTLRESRSCHFMKILESLFSFIGKRILSLKEMSPGEGSSGCQTREGDSDGTTDDNYLREERSPLAITTLYSTSRRGRATFSDPGYGAMHDWNCDMNIHGALILILAKFEEIMFGPEVDLGSAQSPDEATPTTTASTARILSELNTTEADPSNQAEGQSDQAPMSDNAVFEITTEGSGMVETGFSPSELDVTTRQTVSETNNPLDVVEWYRTQETTVSLTSTWETTVTDEATTTLSSSTSLPDADLEITTIPVRRRKQHLRHNPAPTRQESRPRHLVSENLKQMREPKQEEDDKGHAEVNRDEGRRRKKKKMLRGRLNRNRLGSQNGGQQEHEQNSDENNIPIGISEIKELKPPKLKKGHKANVAENENVGDTTSLHETHHVKTHSSTNQKHEDANFGKNGRPTHYHVDVAQTHDDTDMGQHIDAKTRHSRSSRQRRAIGGDMPGTLLSATAAPLIDDFQSYIETLLENHCESIEILIAISLPSQTTNESQRIHKMEEDQKKKFPAIFNASVQSGCVIPDDFEQKKVELVHNLDDALKFVKTQQGICKDG